MIRRTILEWESISFGEGEGAIPAHAANRIAAVAATSPLAGRRGNGVLEYRRKALNARGVVGVIAAEGCALEILPKIDVPNAIGKTARSAGIRRRLVHMLAVAFNMRIFAGDITDHDYQNETLLELLITLFSTKLADAIRQGMPRRYINLADDLPTLRGRLDVTRQFTEFAASPQRLACHYDELSEDIDLNRIMKAATLRLAAVARSVNNQSRLRELAFAYASVTSTPIALLRWDTLVIDRTNARWQQLLNLAKLLLGERFQTTTSGPEGGFSLLFEMSALFEEYVARMMLRALAGTGSHVVAQGGRLYCLESEGGAKLFQTKPDILVKRNGVVEQVIDTKWKRISKQTADPKFGVHQADVYQMMAYGQIYECSRLVLLYPHHDGLGDNALAVEHRIATRDRDDRLKVATVAICTNSGTTDQLRKLCT